MGRDPEREPIRVITLSREYGAGGLDVGHALARRLGVDFVDRTLVEEVARRLRCSADAIDQWDERGESLILRLLRALRSAHPEYASPAALASEVFGNDPHPDRIVTMVQEVIREEARLRRSVILGRGGAFVLAGWPGVFQVRLVARRADRIRRIAERAQLREDEAARRTDQADRERRTYIKHYYGADLSDSTHFTVTLNTSQLAVDDVVEIILCASGMTGANGGSESLPDPA